VSIQGKEKEGRKWRKEEKGGEDGGGGDKGAEGEDEGDGKHDVEEVVVDEEEDDKTNSKQGTLKERYRAEEEDEVKEGQGGVEGEEEVEEEGGNKNKHEAIIRKLSQSFIRKLNEVHASEKSTIIFSLVFNSNSFSAFSCLYFLLLLFFFFLSYPFTMHTGLQPVFPRPGKNFGRPFVRGSALEEGGREGGKGRLAERKYYGGGGREGGRGGWED